MIIISKYSSNVEYNIRTTLDSSGVSKLQAELKAVQAELVKMANLDLISDASFQEAQQKVNKVKSLLSSSFNSKIGMLDMSKFTKGLGNVGEIQSAFAKAGVQGEKTFNNMIGQLGKMDTQIKSVSKSTDKMMNTLGNTVRWGIVASGFQEMMNSIHNAAQYVKDLDTSLTNIMMVTDYSRQQMNEYAKSANEVAKSLGSTTVAMTDATAVFAQQGFDLPQSQQLATMSTKLAHASGQETSVTSDQITAYMNAYGMDSNMEELSKSLDAWAEVANDSAADVKELAVASQKAAATANTVGVNMDQLAAQIATIESVTKDAPMAA